MSRSLPCSVPYSCRPSRAPGDLPPQRHFPAGGHGNQVSPRIADHFNCPHAIHRAATSLASTTPASSLILRLQSLSIYCFNKPTQPASQAKGYQRQDGLWRPILPSLPVNSHVFTKATVNYLPPSRIIRAYHFRYVTSRRRRTSTTFLPLMRSPFLISSIIISFATHLTLIATPPASASSMPLAPSQDASATM